MELFKVKGIQFNSILNGIYEYLNKSIGTTTNIGVSSVFGQMITMVSGIAQNIMNYIEDAFTEQNKYTAQRKKSVYGLAAQSGYQISTGSAAGVWLKIDAIPNNENGLDLVIKDKARIVCSQNGLYYTIMLPHPTMVVGVNNNDGAKLVYAAQGRMEKQRYIVGTATPLYAQNIRFTGFIDTGYLSVQVNGETWTQCESLYDMPAEGKCYTIAFNPVNGLDIIFGNGLHGKELRVEDVIDVTYLMHDGEMGNVKIDDNSYFVFADNLNDVSGEEVDGNALVSMRFASKDAVVAGSDMEDLRTARMMIGYNSRAMVLANDNNFKQFYSQFNFVGYNKTWNDQGSMIIKTMAMQNHKLKMSYGQDYFNLNPEDFLLTDIQKVSLRNAVNKSGRLLAGASYDVVDASLAKYALYVYIKPIDDGISREMTTVAIMNTIGDFMSNLGSDRYIPKSDIINKIKNNVAGIDGVNVYIISEANETALRHGYYDKVENTFNPITRTYIKKVNRIPVFAGENPNLGFDEHGNIFLEDEWTFPVFMGGWQWMKNSNEFISAQPITIIYE